MVCSRLKKLWKKLSRAAKFLAKHRTVHAESCGQIVVGDEGLCFESGNKSCVPPEIKKVGLDVYKIDLADIKKAENAGFYPTLAAELGGLFVQIDYDDVNCATLN
jgi:hypothetical protein